MMDTRTAANRTHQLIGIRDRCLRKLGLARTAATAAKLAHEDTEKAHALIQKVAVSTQEALQVQISEIGSMAMQAVFHDPYKLHIAFEPKRGRSEAQITFERDGNQVDPMGESGGGTVDLASFALRVTFLSLERGTMPVLILDEPLKNLSKELHPLAGEFITEISHRLGIQMIIITHELGLAELADRVFVVEKDGRKSRVTQMKRVTK